MPQISNDSGVLYIVSAPSGGGKTSLVKALVENDENVRVSVSYCTRQPRPGEQNGVNYHFVDAATFQNLIAADAFLEYARVFDHYYGTARAAVVAELSAGKDLILEIDWQGARQVRASMPECVGIFILPPSYEQLELRLRTRAADDDTVVARRMRDAVNEMSHFAEYDYLIINDDFDRALSDLRAVLQAGRLRSGRQQRLHAALIEKLMA